MPSHYLLKHVGNMGDLVFFLPPVLKTLKRREPDCHITLITAWGFKDKRGRWGKRNQGGFCINLMLTNPHVDQLIHWHDKALSLAGNICIEEGQKIPTWNPQYYEVQKKSGHFAAVYELDFGIGIYDNPITKLYEAMNLDEDFSDYKLYLSAKDLQVAKAIMEGAPNPRIVFLEGLAGQTTRGWDPRKVDGLTQAIINKYKVAPIWFGAAFVPDYQGRPLTLRENIATLTFCDAGIGVLSGPLHFAAAVGLPTLTLYGDHPLHRAAPAYFLNRYIKDSRRRHRTLLAPSHPDMKLLKNNAPSPSLTTAEVASQHSQGWLNPGRQSTKTCLAVLTVEEVMTVLADIVPA